VCSSDLEGYIEDVIAGRDLNNRSRWSARGQLLWEGDSGSVRIIADKASTDEQCCYGIPLQNSPLFSALIGVNGGPATSLAGLTGATGLLTPNPEGLKASVSSNRDIAEVVDEWGVSGQVDWDIGGLDFTSISSYRDWEVIRGQDVDFNDTDRAYRAGDTIAYETLTQEFRLHGENGRLDWLVGAFYLDEKALNNSTIRFGEDAALFNDLLVAGAAGAQFFGTVGPMALPAGFGVTAGLPAGFRANLVGASFLQGALSAASATAAFNTLAQLGQAGAMGNTTAQAQYNALLGGYNGIAGAFSAAAPVAGRGQQADRFEVDTQGIALFTHNIITLTDQLSLTVGARYNKEEKTLTANLNSDDQVCGVLQSTAPIGPGAPSINQIVQSIVAASPSAAGLFTIGCNPVVNTVANGAYSDTLEEDAFTGTLSLSFKASEDLLVYGGYSRGYKSGGFNLDRSGFNITPFSTTKPSTDDLAFDPEFNDAYELGAKYTLPNGGTLNTAIFHQTISDYQNNAFSGFNFITFNVPEVISKGIEVDLNTPLTENLNLQAGLLYNDAYYNSTVALDPSRPDSETLESGSPIAQVPEWSVTGALFYRRPISETLEVTAYLDGRWNSEYTTQTLSRDPITDNEAFAIFNARLGIGREDDTWSTELFVRNLTDERFYLGAFSPPEQSGSYNVYPSQPRMYGLTVRTNF
jgi:outer membrane receptor protein involved in Fe transport